MTVPRSLVLVVVVIAAVTGCAQSSGDDRVAAGSDPGSSSVVDESTSTTGDLPRAEWTEAASEACLVMVDQLAGLDVDDPQSAAQRAEIRDAFIATLKSLPAPPEMASDVEDTIQVLEAESAYDEEIARVAQGGQPTGVAPPTGANLPDLGLQCDR